jgi:hypothetical protein
MKVLRTSGHRRRRTRQRFGGAYDPIPARPRHRTADLRRIASLLLVASNAACNSTARLGPTYRNRIYGGSGASRRPVEHRGVAARVVHRPSGEGALYEVSGKTNLARQNGARSSDPGLTMQAMQVLATPHAGERSVVRATCQNSERARARQTKTADEDGRRQLRAAPRLPSPQLRVLATSKLPAQRPP